MDASLYPQLKAFLLAETDPQLVEWRDTGNNGGMALWLNEIATPAFIVWRSSVPTSEIFAAITFSSMTPVDTPDSTATYTNRALMCQAKQINLQTMLIGRDTLPTNKATIRAALQDALTNVPAGAGGTTLDAGWLGAGKVRLTIQRTVTRAERIFATGTGSQATPGDLVFEGAVSSEDARLAMAGA